MPTEIISTKINGILELIGEYYTDSRGQFLNCFRFQDSSFSENWPDIGISQVNVSRTNQVGTIRGLHFQENPHSEAKLVRCLRGRAWDVAADVRTDSPTYGQWHAVELTPKSCNALLIPEGCAHGFQILEPFTELLYLHSGQWVPKLEKGIRFDDPTLAIKWPLLPFGISKRDRDLPFLLI